MKRQIDIPQRRERTEAASVETTQHRTAQKTRWRSWQLDGLLIFISMIWGSTFLLVKNIIKFTGPFTYLALCFSIAAVVLSITFRKHLRAITRTELLTGALVGAILFSAYAMQTIGLQFTTVSKAGFITGLYVPLVPILSFILLRQRPALEAVVGILLSVIGLILLSVDNTFNLAFSLGELLVLGCAFGFALHIVSIGKFLPNADAINLAIIQISVTAVLSIIALPFMHEKALLLPPSPLVWGGVLFMALMDTALTVTIMNWVQQYVSGTRAALIYALEPAWAGLFGFLAGESLSLLALIGCICIFSAMIIGKVRLTLPNLSVFKRKV